MSNCENEATAKLGEVLCATQRSNSQAASGAEKLPNKPISRRKRRRDRHMRQTTQMRKTKPTRVRLGKLCYNPAFPLAFAKFEPLRWHARLGLTEEAEAG
jgi:hypothetical protein